jgi:phosphate-selective porin OprO and OprP
MRKLNRVFWGTLSFVALAAGQAHAQSANINDAEISALKQQLYMMVQKLDKLQQQTAADMTAAANANAKADAKINVAGANAAYPVGADIASGQF